jgi:hypothetical protein
MLGPATPHNWAGLSVRMNKWQPPLPVRAAGPCVLLRPASCVLRAWGSPSPLHALTLIMSPAAPLHTATLLLDPPLPAMLQPIHTHMVSAGPRLAPPLPLAKYHRPKELPPAPAWRFLFPLPRRSPPPMRCRSCVPRFKLPAGGHHGTRRHPRAPRIAWPASAQPGIHSRSRAEGHPRVYKQMCSSLRMVARLREGRKVRLREPRCNLLRGETQQRPTAQVHASKKGHPPLPDG